MSDDRLRKLRLRAEKAIQDAANPIRVDLNVQELVHELQVYQAELEAQNEELLQAQHLIERQVDEITLLFERAPVAYFVLNADGTIKKFNERAFQLMHKAPVPDRPVPFFLMFGVRDARPKLLEWLQDDQAGALELQHSVSPAVWHLLEKQLLKAGELMVSATDITEQVKAQNKLRVLAEDLALANDKIREISKIRTQFLSSMSHDLRTPLNAILGFAQLLQHRAGTLLSRSENEYLESIIHSGELLLALVNKILDLHQIESDAVQLYPENTPVHQLINECIALVAPLAQQRGVRFDHQDSGNLSLEIWADQLRLKQVLINLFSNAIKYNRVAGSVTVTAGANDDGTVRVRVQDTGPGIPAADHDRIFEMFQRGQRSIMVSTEGAGVGLFVSKSLVELMGGSIGVESQPGGGSCFWFDLPAGRPPLTPR